MGEARAEALIDAPIDVVWAVMLDTDRYGEWNPFIVEVGLPAARPPVVGDPIVLHVRWGDGGGAKASEWVTTLEPPDPHDGARAVLDYDYGGPLAALRLVRGRRRQELERRADGLTAYRTHERLHGLLAWAAPLRKVQDGFERHAVALKARAEAL